MRIGRSCPVYKIRLKTHERQKQILRLTTNELHPADGDLSAGAPELKGVRGPVRS
jgi:hypothetical protein